MTNLDAKERKKKTGGGAVPGTSPSLQVNKGLDVHYKHGATPQPGSCEQVTAATRS